MLLAVCFSSQLQFLLRFECPSKVSNALRGGVLIEFHETTQYRNLKLSNIHESSIFISVLIGSVSDDIGKVTEEGLPYASAALDKSTLATA